MNVNVLIVYVVISTIYQIKSAEEFKKNLGWISGKQWENEKCVKNEA